MQHDNLEELSSHLQEVTQEQDQEEQVLLQELDDPPPHLHHGCA